MAEIERSLAPHPAEAAPALVWACLPLLMIAAFLLLPAAGGAASGIALFALAGLACSAFLPLSITLAAHRFPHDVAFVASMLVAALMVGVGLGSFAIGALREMLPFEDLYRRSIRRSCCCWRSRCCARRGGIARRIDEAVSQHRRAD